MKKITQEELDQLINYQQSDNKVYHFKDLDMSGLTISCGSDFSHSVIENCDMSNMDLVGVDFSSSWFANCDLRNSDLRNSNFTYAEMEKSSFNKSNMTNSIMKRSRLVDVDFSEVRLAGVSFIFAQIKNINVEKSTLLNANFDGAVFEEEGLVGLDKVTSLKNVIGDGKLIKSLVLPLWTVTITPTHIQIGCQYHPIEKWVEFTDEEIAEMSPCALDWWKRWKPTIVSVVNNKS